MAEGSPAEKMEKLVALCKRRGFIFQSSEIYGGLNGAWDYGPLGVELKRNIKEYWWRCMVHQRDDIVGMDGAILMNRAVWKASGHEATFSDPMVECLATNKRLRADQIPEQSGIVYRFSGARSEAAGWKAEKPFEVLLPKGENSERARKLARLFYSKGAPDAATGDAGKFTLEEAGSEPVENSRRHNPENGGLLSEPRAFNLMFKTYVGPVESDENVTYLRPETAQAMFVQFRNVLDTARKKLPFGIAQIGKAFRNEINPRNFTFRSREFEQMEVEFFVKPGTGHEWLERWKEERLAWYESIGLPRAKVHVLEVPEKDRAFYSKGTYDLEYDFPFGRQELEGIAYRTDYDLTQHQQASGKPLEYFDEETKEKFIPHVVEPSAGVDRTVLAILCEAYAEEEVTDEKGKKETRVVMRFHPRVAPIKAGVFPLLKNKPELVGKAREVAALLRGHMNVFYDEAGAIGRRYRRMDEAGTPFGITIDFETLEGAQEPSGTIAAGQKDTVTLRHRDSMKQERVPIAELPARLLAEVR